MKRIISYSLWGDSPRYTIGAIKNAKLAKEVYPDWICRFYVGKNTPLDIINELKSFDNTEVIEMGIDGDWTGMFWRFYPAGEEDVHVMLSRDVDSRLCKREVAAVDEWLASDKDFHIMRDHPYHNTLILGGMWGVRGDILSGIKKLIDNYIKGDFWQVDQNFLREKIYPIIKDDYFYHDEFFEINPFPVKRKGGIDPDGFPIHFIGKPVDENDIRI